MERRSGPYNRSLSMVCIGVLSYRCASSVVWCRGLETLSRDEPTISHGSEPANANPDGPLARLSCSGGEVTDREEREEVLMG